MRAVHRAGADGWRVWSPAASFPASQRFRCRGALWSGLRLHALDHGFTGVDRGFTGVESG
jgi:hypothetical protein